VSAELAIVCLHPRRRESASGLRESIEQRQRPGCGADHIGGGEELLRLLQRGIERALAGAHPTPQVQAGHDAAPADTATIPRAMHCRVQREGSYTLRLVGRYARPEALIHRLAADAELPRQVDLRLPRRCALP